jgi:hypothetical protein
MPEIIKLNTPQAIKPKMKVVKIPLILLGSIALSG